MSCDTMSNLIRYRCNNKNCVVDFFRGGAEDTECPVCQSRNVTIVEFGVKE